MKKRQFIIVRLGQQQLAPPDDQFCFRLLSKAASTVLN